MLSNDKRAGATLRDVVSSKPGALLRFSDMCQANVQYHSPTSGRLPSSKSPERAATSAMVAPGICSAMGVESCKQFRNQTSHGFEQVCFPKTI